MTKYLAILSVIMITISSCGKKVTEVTQVTEVKNNAFGITFQVKPSEWQPDDNHILYTAALDVPELSDPIYQSGAVITYLRFASQDLYEALPETFDGIAYGTSHVTGFVVVDYHALDGTDPGTPDEDIFIKIVLIPAEMAKAHPGVDLNNFKEVEKTFLQKQ